MERLGAEKGAAVDLDRVLLIADGENLTVGNPLVEGAKVTATSQGETKGDKIIVFKFKAKKRYYNKTGHRQLYTTLTIDKIVGPGMATEEPAKKPRRSKKKVETTDGS